MLIICGVPVTVILGFHIYLALVNKTTWETVAHDRITYLQSLKSDENPFNQVRYYFKLRTILCFVVEIFMILCVIITLTNSRHEF